YPKGSGFELTAFSDVDHAGCIDTSKSTFGGIQFLDDKLVSWMSKKQDCTQCHQQRLSTWRYLQVVLKTEYQLADMFTKALPEDRITTARRVSTVRRIKTRERIKMKIVYQDYLRDKPLREFYRCYTIHTGIYNDVDAENIVKYLDVFKDEHIRLGDVALYTILHDGSAMVNVARDCIVPEAPIRTIENKKWEPTQQCQVESNKVIKPSEFAKRSLNSFDEDIIVILEKTKIIAWENMQKAKTVVSIRKHKGRNIDFKAKTTCFSSSSQRLMCYNCKEKGILLENVDLEGVRWSRWLGLGNDFEVITSKLFALMAISSSSSSSSSDSENYELKCREIKINNLNLELKKAVKERDELKDKISKWEESTKNLDEILKSQLSARDKTGLGYSTQLNELSSNHETDSENSFSVFDDRSSDEESTPANDRSSQAEGYKVVPPPIIGNFLTPKVDISFVGKTTGQTNDANTVKPKSVSESVVSNPKINRDRVIIEDWHSDDEEEVSEVQKVRPENQTVKTRDNKSDQNSQKQGVGFRKVKAYFVCRSTEHLIKDCNFHDKKSQESNLKNMVNTSQREGKPVWDNTTRVNHQNFSKYPHLSETFIPSGVLTRTGLHRSSINTARPVCTARPSICTARPSINTVRPSVSTARPSVSTARPVYATRPTYPRKNNVRPRGSCSPIKRSYYTKPVYRPKDLKQDVQTFRVQNITSAGIRAVVNTGKGKLNTDLKRTSWVWRPKGNYLDHVSKDSGSFMLKKGNPEILLQDHAVVDSGCSIHMTGNKAYLLDYEDFNRGFVAFGSDPKGECLILSPSFKLLDESQVVLRAPRKDDVYSLDLNNIIPSRGSSGKDKGPTQEYILLLLQSHRTRIPIKDVVQDAQEKPSKNVSPDKDIQDSEDVINKEGQHQIPEDEQVLHDELEKMVTQELTAKAMDDVSRQAFNEEKRRIASQKKAAQATSANAGESSFVYLGGKIPIDASTLPNADLPIDPNMPDLEDASDTLPNDGIFNGSPIPTLRIHKDHPKGQILGDPTSAVQTRGKIQKASSAQQALVSYIHRQNRTNHKDHQNCLFACFLSQEEPKTISQALQDESWVKTMHEELLQFKLQKVWVLVDLPYGKRIEAIRLFLAFASYMGFTIYQMDVKSAFIYGTIEEEVKTKKQNTKVSQPSDPTQPMANETEDVESVRIHSNDPPLTGEDRLKLNELMKLYTNLSQRVLDLENINISLAIEISKLKEKVKKLERRSKSRTLGLKRLKKVYGIGSLMYLTASRPNIMFAVCAYARFQDSPFELEAFSDNDYGGASLDRKSTTEYVIAANCCGQVLWIQNQMMDYGFNFMNTKIHIDNESTISVIKNPLPHF
ncbi:uncharacterized mitochondrial protein-like protein, partial [Tanacetum coccineum]